MIYTYCISSLLDPGLRVLSCLFLSSIIFLKLPFMTSQTSSKPIAQRKFVEKILLPLMLLLAEQNCSGMWTNPASCDCHKNSATLHHRNVVPSMMCHVHYSFAARMCFTLQYVNNNNYINKYWIQIIANIQDSRHCKNVMDFLMINQIIMLRTLIITNKANASCLVYKFSTRIVNMLDLNHHRVTPA